MPLQGNFLFNFQEIIDIRIKITTFFHLKQKCDGICIKKTRYCIPYQNYMIELDIFHDRYEGLILAEVEFDSVEESKLFEKPSWFLEDVSEKVDYTNSYLAQK